MPNHYYLLRHGQSTANHHGLIVSCAELAINGYGLTDLGIEQVSKAAVQSRFDSRLVLVSSDYLRARQTAEIFADIIGVSQPVLYEKGLRERDFGRWNMQEDKHYQTVWKHDAMGHCQTDQQVESVSSTLNRGLQTVRRLDEHYKNRNILLVGHGDVLQILLAYCCNINPRLHRTMAPIKNAEVRRLPLRSNHSRAAS